MSVNHKCALMATNSCMRLKPPKQVKQNESFILGINKNMSNNATPTNLLNLCRHFSTVDTDVANFECFKSTQASGVGQSNMIYVLRNNTIFYSNWLKSPEQKSTTVYRTFNCGLD